VSAVAAASSTRDEPTAPSRRFYVILAAVLLAGLAWRVGYVLAQPASDPWFARPAFDGAYYLNWARSLVDGTGGPEGAFYLAPLFPHLLAPFLAVFGASFGLLYMAQHVVALATAGLIGIATRRKTGESAALCSALLYLLYPPLLYFASRPLSETVALFFLFAALGGAWRDRPRGAFVAGLLAAIGALARPNLILVPLLWLVGEVAARRCRRALLTAAGVALVLLPVAARNLVASGHPVPISSNGGLTAYHGNGPGALGVYTPPPGFSGNPLTQQDEATLLAQLRSGRQLDAVEADRWWGRRALGARAEDPGGTVRLIMRRALMVLDSHEYGLDYNPNIDANPWRLTRSPGALFEIAFVPLGLLIGLSLAGVVLLGPRGTGGWRSWSALAACAAAPLLFYVSSRYRLPFAALLVVPAGAGLAALGSAMRRGVSARLWLALALAVAAAALSLAMPFTDLKRSMTGDALAKRAAAHARNGAVQLAQRDADRALQLAPRSAKVRLGAGLVARSRGDLALAEQSFAAAVELDPGLAEAAANLAALRIERGDVTGTIPILRRALLVRPTCESCWTNLAVAYLALGDVDSAARARQEARDHGIELDPGLVRAIEQGAE
jgi:Flp pilus assembly protein TadD